MKDNKDLMKPKAKTISYTDKYDESCGKLIKKLKSFHRYASYNIPIIKQAIEAQKKAIIPRRER